MKKVIFVLSLLLLSSALMSAILKPEEISLPKPKCSDYIVNYSIFFNSIKLRFDFSKSNPDGSSYTHWEYDDDRNEINNAHYVNHSNDGNITGYFDSFASIMDCYWNSAYGYYHNNAPTREPSISVTYTGQCDGSVTCKYLPVQYDPQHYYTDNVLIGAPTIGPNNINKGAFTAKSIKTKKNGVQLKWQYTIDSNDILNLDELADNTQTKSANTAPITMYAVITSDVPRNDSELILINKHGTTIGVYKRTQVKSSTTDSFSIVENTVPKELVGKTVQLSSTDDVVCSPHLDGSVYICGEYSTAVKWNKPYLYRVIEK